MVLIKSALRERSHAQARRAEHGEHPPLDQVLGICWLSTQAKCGLGWCKGFPIPFGERELNYAWRSG